ncbi:MAG: hypothetical protein P4L67_04575 [Candidatus Pacebacteria bacterium]|nr:hypothetical protein [Candidatus Paceibacterota bacterium]
MSLDLEQAADILRRNRYLGIGDWSYDGCSVVAEGVGVLFDSHAIKRANGYLGSDPEYLASLGGVPVLNEEVESSPHGQGLVDSLERLKMFLIEKHEFDHAATIVKAKNCAKNVIAESKASAIPSADEALAIINENNHNGLKYKLFVSNAGTTDPRNAAYVLPYEEFIGTAMFYKAKKAN